MDTLTTRDLKDILNIYLVSVQQYLESNYSSHVLIQIYTFIFNFECDINLISLNELRIILARSIPGSPMEETNYHFSKTRKLIEDITVILENSLNFNYTHESVGDRIDDLVIAYNAYNHVIS